MARSKAKRKSSEESEAKEDQVRIRHSMDTQLLVDINANLTDVQRQVLEQTPFKWLLSINNTLKISCIVLRELVSRWVQGATSFRIRHHYVPFTPVDVCFALGLRISGEAVSLVDVDDGECKVKCLFKGEDMTVENIVKKLKQKKLKNDKNVEEFCRLYILLAFAVFYFPRTTPTVNNVPFKLLDDVEALHEYNWGVAVYKMLCDSIFRASVSFNEQRNNSELHIAGCAAVLQIWAVEHLSLPTVSKSTSFPRLVQWPVVIIRTSKVEKAFRLNKVIWEWAATEEHKSYAVVQEALDIFQQGFRPSIVGPFDLQEILTEHRMLKAQNEANEKRISALESKLKALEDKVNGQTTTATEEGEGTTTKADEIVVKKKVKHESGKGNAQGWKILYRFCTSNNQSNLNRVLVDVHDQILTCQDLQSMKPRGWVDNMVILFATSLMMYDEMQQNGGTLNRLLLSPIFADRVIKDLELPKAAVTKWSNRTYSFFVPKKIITVDKWLHCELLFAPVVHNRHWFCYVVNWKERMMYVLDSLGHDHDESRKALDNAMRLRFEEMLSDLDGTNGNTKLQLQVTFDDLPQQPNHFDCGLYVLKYMELWDGVKKYNGKAMPKYTSAEIQTFREEYVCRWILHPLNGKRNIVLEDAGVSNSFGLQ